MIAQEKQGSGSGFLEFNIPAEELVLALDAYSVATGREVFYDGALVVGRRSAPVNGRLSSDVALRILLGGTDFIPRPTGPHSFTIVLAPRQPFDHERADMIARQNITYRGFFASLQADVKHAFCHEAGTRPGAFRLVIKFWLSPEGQIWRSQLVGSTGDSRRDRLFSLALIGMKTDEPPPDLPQPITMVVLPRLADEGAECTASADSPGPVQEIHQTFPAGVTHD
ncbi:MAG: STN domain-containing protein [Pseudomonadota bacterium]